VNQASHPICEKDIHLSRFDNRRNFALTELRMQHGLSAPVSAGAIVRRANLGGSSTNGAALVWNTRAADRATNSTDPPRFGYGSDCVAALLTAGNAHLFDSIPKVKSFLIFHNAPSIK
jgi:hypothetical protein